VTAPLSCTICRLGLAMINVHTIFKVSVFTHNKDMKGIAKCRIWGVCGVVGVRVTQGYWHCHHSIERLRLLI